MSLIPVIGAVMAAGAGGPPVGGEWERFDPTGAEQTISVPAGVTSCEAFVIGAGGGQGIYNGGGSSGAGGYSQGTFSVTTGETLKLRPGAGGQGGRRETGNNFGGIGGYPGGGSGAWGDTWCGGGGGYSGVFRNDGTPLLIAGGGGGGSGYSLGAGAGGGTSGGSGGGGGGTQIAGGAGTYPGSAYQGGNANGGDRFTTTSFDCGGGGGGYYGGGAPSFDGSTGGGGSGHIGSGVTGNTYAGANMTRPAQVPATINGESTTGLGVGVAGANNTGGAGPQQGTSGGDGAIWLHFT